MDADKALSDFGIFPGPGTLAPEKVRSTLKRHNVIFQLVMSFLMVGGSLAVGVVLGGLARRWPDPVLIVSAPLMFVIAAILAILAGDAYLWVELDGDIVRARNLYTGRITERPVGEILEVKTLYIVLRDDPRTAVAEAIQGRIRGFAIRFEDRERGIRLFRPEMTEVGSLIEAVIAKMAERGEVKPEIVEFEGRPMIKRVTWAGSDQG